MSYALLCAVVSRGPSTTAVTTHGLSYAYPRSTTPVLADVDLSVGVGEHVAVVGRSGCGKSTLLSLVAGLTEPTGGRVAVLGEQSAPERLASCALVPQGDSLLPWLSLVDNVAIGLRNLGMSRRLARAEASTVLSAWGLDGWANTRPAALSGGMRQRATLVRALLADKPLLLADEPLGALDAITRAEAQQWLREAITHTSATLIMVTHDVEEALLCAERVVLLAPRGPGGPAAVIAQYPGWFSDGRPRESLLGDPRFAAARQEILETLALSSSAYTGIGTQ